MFEIKLNFYCLSSMLQFSQFVWPLSYSVWDVFNNFLLIDATDRSKISSDQKHFFIALSVPPFHFSWTLPLMVLLFSRFFYIKSWNLVLSFLNHYTKLMKNYVQLSRQNKKDRFLYFISYRSSLKIFLYFISFRSSLKIDSCILLVLGRH